MVIASGSDNNVPLRHSPTKFPEGNLVLYMLDTQHIDLKLETVIIQVDHRFRVLFIVER